VSIARGVVHENFEDVAAAGLDGGVLVSAGAGSFNFDEVLEEAEKVAGLLR